MSATEAVPSSSSSSHSADRRPSVPASVLVVEDDSSVADALATMLTRRGYLVEVAPTVQRARDILLPGDVDVILLDLGLPDGDGTTFCLELRTWFRNPIIVITAEGDEVRLVEALDAGADDYVTKPFSTPALLARIRVALRHRSVLAGIVDPHPLAVGDMVLDTGAYSVEIAGDPVALTLKEFELLKLLASNPGRIARHSTIIDQVWDGVGSPESLRVVVAKLRKKLGSGDQRPRIETETGVGYRLVVPT